MKPTLKPLLAGALLLAFVTAPLAAIACDRGSQSQGDSGDRVERDAPST